MPNDLSERKAAARRQYRTQNNRVNDPAVLGNSNNTLADPNLPGNVLIQVQSSNGLLDNRSVRAPTKPFPLIPGTPIKLKRDYMGRLQVDEQDNELMLALGVDPVAQAIASQSPSTPQSNFETFRCIPMAVPSTFVNVKAANFRPGLTAYQFGGASLDLGPGDANVIPGAGLKARIVVALKSDYLTLEATTSTPRGVSDVDLNTQDLNEALALLSAESIPSWYIDLEDDQTEITVSDITPSGDLRNTINLPDTNIPSRRVALTAQTTSIGATNIVTPASDGEYIASVVLTDTTTSTSGGTVLATILYNDENGAQSQVTASVLLSVLGYATSLLTFHARTTVAIRYSTTVSGVIVGSPQYSLYINVTRIS